jgi:cytidine deaminase
MTDHYHSVGSINSLSQVAAACAKYDMTTLQFQALYQNSVAAKAAAYCPYSNFRVGASILAEDGQYIDGANVENAAYAVAICAERVAMAQAVAKGNKSFRAVAVATNITPPASPCGVCRQL